MENQNIESIVEAINMEEIKGLSIDELSEAYESAKKKTLKIVDGITENKQAFDELHESILREEFLRAACKQKDSQIEALKKQIKA